MRCRIVSRTFLKMWKIYASYYKAISWEQTSILLDLWSMYELIWHTEHEGGYPSRWSNFARECKHRFEVSSITSTRLPWSYFVSAIGLITVASGLIFKLARDCWMGHPIFSWYHVSAISFYWQSLPCDKVFPCPVLIFVNFSGGNLYT